MAEKAILYDATKCTACRGCQVACKQWNELEAEETTNRGTYENPPDLSPDTWLKMRFLEYGDTAKGDFSWLFVRRACMHCTDAACVKVCPTGALYHHDLGFVGYDKDKCSGCGYCTEFCPFNVPKKDGSTLTGLGKIDKCIFCIDRVYNDEEPACVKTCPPGALIYGDRDDMVAEGRSRVAALVAAGHANATLYGEKELGGLHVLYVLADKPEVYELPADPKVSGAATAWQDILQPLGIGAAALVGGGLLLNLMVTRARAIQEQEKKEG